MGRQWLVWRLEHQNQVTFRSGCARLDRELVAGEGRPGGRVVMGPRWAVQGTAMGPDPRPVERLVREQDVSPTVTIRDMPFLHTQGTSGDIGISPLVTHWLRLLFLAQMLVAALNSRKSPALRSGPGSAATLLGHCPLQVSVFPSVP